MEDDVADKKDDIKECNLMAELMYQKQFNVGKYENEVYKIAIQGSYNEIRDGKSLIPLLMPTLYNMQLMVAKTQQRKKLEDVMKEQASATTGVSNSLPPEKEISQDKSDSNKLDTDI
jgi:hypothetical protein